MKTAKDFQTRLAPTLWERCALGGGVADEWQLLLDWLGYWLQADTPDLDLSVRLTDVYPDGRSMLMLDGIQRARMRCGDDQECFLEPGEPTEIEVDLWSTALVVNAGHRIRVDLAGSNYPRFEVNPNDGGDLNAGTPIVARPTLLFGEQYPSALLLPVIDRPRRPARRASAAD